MATNSLLSSWAAAGAGSSASSATAAEENADGVAVNEYSGSGYIAISCRNDILLLDATTHQTVSVLKDNGTSSTVGQICVDAANTRLACTVWKSVGAHYSILIWDLDTKQLLRTIQSGDLKFAYMIDLNKDATKLLAVESPTLNISVYDIMSGECLFVVDGAKDRLKATVITRLKFTCDDSQFICGYGSGPSVLFDASSGEKIVEYQRSTAILSSPVTRILCSPDGSTCFIASAMELRAYQVSTGTVLWSETYGHSIRDMCFGSDCNELSVAMSGKTVIVIDAWTGSTKSQYTTSNNIRAMAFNHASNSLVVQLEGIIQAPKVGRATEKHRLPGTICCIDAISAEVTTILDNWDDNSSCICCSLPAVIFM
jgi:WD40 repeat protein